jgi:hypothetical protein
LKHFALTIAALAMAAPASAAFDPVAFFKGKTHGEGQAKVILKPSKSVSVDSEGHVEPDGTLVLNQRVLEEGKPPRVRHWRLRKTSPTHFEGSLSDAVGPVVVDLIGDRARVRFSGKNHLKFEQWLTPKSKSVVLNTMRVKRLGIVVAHFTETIRKVD